MTDSPDHTDLPDVPELTEDYELLRELGRGRKSVVYLARERELNRLVAIKVLQPRYVEDEDAAAALVHEARTLGALHHRSLLTLYGTRRLRDGTLALIREYLPGRDLRSELQETGPLPLHRAHQVLEELATVLAYLHQRQLLHHNLRPEHVLLEENTGHVRLSGFGSPAGSPQVGAGFAREAMASAAYMAPEQLGAGTEDGRTDVYALGVLGYEMLTGQTPWPAASLFTIVERRLHQPTPSPALRRPDTPASLSGAVERALHIEPADRWETAVAFREALGEPPAEAPDLPTPVADGGTEDPAAVAGRVAGAWGGLSHSVVSEGPSYTAARPQPGRHSRRRKVRAAWAVSIVVLAALAWWVLTRSPMSLGPGGGGIWSGTADGPGGAPRDPAAPLQTRPGEYGEAPGTSAAAGVPAVAYVLSGDAQEGAVGDTMRQWLTVRVEDATGRPVAGVPVRFAVREGESFLTPETSATDEYGVAGARLVPRAPGDHVVEAVIADLGGSSPVFRARALPPGDSAAAAEPAVGERLAVRSGVSAGGMHSCALAADGSAACWGGNDSGQLGDGSAQRRGSPVRVAAPEPLTSLYAGVTHSCGVGASGSVFCWGANAAGQLGDGTRAARSGPVRVATRARLVTLAAGAAHSCGLDAGGLLYCWGRNAHGQLGDGSRTDRSTPVRAGGRRTFRSVAVGWDHTCALSANGTAFCWGRNQAGQLGDGSGEDRAAPTQVAGGRRFRSITAGSGHTCALTEAGAAWCWGQNAYGQLGTGDPQGAAAPAAVAGEDRFQALTAGGVHTCGRTSAGLARCWGRNNYGQLGDGTTQDRATPVPVQGGLRFSALHATGAHTCGTAGGASYCWGYNLEGQLGDGTRSNQQRPVAVIVERE